MSYKIKKKIKKIKPEFDVNGWAKAELYKPEEYELVLVENSTGRRQHAWWTGCIWDFGGKRIDSDVIAWKHSEYKD